MIILSKYTHRGLGLVATLALALSSGIAAAQATPTKTKPAVAQQICGSTGCETFKAPKQLGSISSIQSAKFVKASRSAALVTGSKGYAVCAAPLWPGEFKCIGINVPHLPGFKFNIESQPNGKFAITTTVKGGDKALLPAYRLLSRQFKFEMARSIDLLNARIEYTRPPTRSANRMQILKDATGTLTMAQENCPYDENGVAQCDRVEIDGSSGDDTCCSSGGEPKEGSHDSDHSTPIESPEEACPSSGASSQSSGSSCPIPKPKAERLVSCLKGAKALYDAQVERCWRWNPTDSYWDMLGRNKCMWDASNTYDNDVRECYSEYGTAD